MDHDTLIKAIVLLASMPWWLPVARSVVSEVWAVANSEAPSEGRRPSASSDPLEGARFGWSDERPSRGLRNARWDIGRPDVTRRAGFGPSRRTR